MGRKEVLAEELLEIANGYKQGAYEVEDSFI